ncbi:hypothetical protein ASE75_07895 [Sphingomonas sp. Leaf17]|uniref:DUF4153 domain-containing protein n=1 Tax=Sphingomonas sp. Leaf17 TaxID=1735683 RepID=UPI0006FC27FF|nr:DUF4173 domain-containing protein [Sphingomonas sp. Leaf17]KQM64972.1 hypothetical protein ASE75_07895 [Sphingomonas sp. Leaf17]
MPRPPSPARFSFHRKVAAAIALVALADGMLNGWLAVPLPAIFALCWTAVLAFAVAAVRRDRRARAALLLALAFALLLVEDPTLLGWSLFWTAIASAALLPRHRFDDAARWAMRLGLHALSGIAAPFHDTARLTRLGRDGQWWRPRTVAATIALPLIGGICFVALFAGANPIISAAFDRIALPSPAIAIAHGVIWCVVLLGTWASFRPHAIIGLVGARGTGPVQRLPDVPVATLGLSLITFNIVFAVQNALDIAFLWSGAALPAGITLADYAHRGAYTLIAAALLAGLFVLVALSPDGAAARQPALRRWLVLWIGQTLLLVASSILRLFDYIAVYSMTVLRLSALAWMLLVAVGLILIVWRLLTARSAAWLINANALAAALVLSAAGVIDLGATAAAWNVRHAHTAGNLDLCYLRGLGPSALLSLIALERRVRGARLQDRVAFVRAEAMQILIEQQANPQDWSWRGARRLRAAETALGPHPRAVAATTNGRNCDGTPFPPPPAPLTPGPEQ